MEIWHHIALVESDDRDHTVEKLGVKHEKTRLAFSKDDYIVAVGIYESDPAWPQINALAKEVKAIDMFETEFSEAEILTAEWVRLAPLLERGYPQPENGWAALTYENECPRCGAGFRQEAPFHLRKEPYLGRSDFLSLLWTHTVFCTPKVLDLLKTNGIVGYEVWPSLIHKTKERSKVVSQLIFPHIAQPGLTDGDTSEREHDWGVGLCHVCGITKYRYHNRGYMHIKREAILRDVDFQVTSEWFGSGAMASREVLISNRVARLFLEHRLGRILLKPIELV